MTPERASKRVLRALRTIPADAIAPFIADFEAGGDGLWCIVGGELSFVQIHGVPYEITIDNPLIPAAIKRWLISHPERVHETHEAAIAGVQSLLAAQSDA